MTSDANRLWTLAGWTLCAAFAIVAALTFRSYGVTWDEGLQHEYGQRVLRYYTSGFRDGSHAQLLDLRYYGPLFEAAAAAVASVAPESQWDIRHALIALAGLAAVLGAMKFAALLAGPRAGFFAALFLILTPQFYGHSFNNSKDIPFAAALTWTAWAAARLVETSRWRYAVLTGLTLGCALAIRVGALFFVGVIAIASMIAAFGNRRLTVRHALQLAAVIVIGWSVMVAAWPWTHEAPLTRPVAAMRLAAAFPNAQATLFEGRVWLSNEMPRRYLPKMLAITTPLPILLLALAGAAMAIRDARRDGARWILILWLFMPLAVYVWRTPPVYDGIRHFLFLLPAVAALASLTQRHRAVIAVTLLSLLPAVVQMVRLHPYQSTYYNALTGGTAGASSRYETDYWLSSYREAMLWINAHRCPGETNVLVAVVPEAAVTATAYAAPGVSVTPVLRILRERHLPEGIDYYVGTTRFGMAVNFPEVPVAATVGRSGATFAVIRGGCR